MTYLVKYDMIYTMGMKTKSTKKETTMKKVIDNKQDVCYTITK